MIHTTMTGVVIHEAVMLLSLVQCIEKVACVQCSYYDDVGLKRLFTCSAMEYCCTSKCCKSLGEFMKYWHFWVCMLLIILLCTCGGCWYARHYYHMKGLYTEALSAPPSTSRWMPRRPFITTWGVLLPSVRNIVRQQQQQRQQQVQQLLSDSCDRRGSSIATRQSHHQQHLQQQQQQQLVSLATAAAATSDEEDVDKIRHVGGILVDSPPPTYVESRQPDTISLPPSYSSALVDQI